MQAAGIIAEKNYTFLHCCTKTILNCSKSNQRPSWSFFYEMDIYVFWMFSKFKESFSDNILYVYSIKTDVWKIKKMLKY